MYPIVELIVALGWMLSVHHYGLTLTALRVAVFGTVLLGVAITDAMHYLIPDGFTLFGLAFALAMSAVGFFLGETQVFATPYNALIGACTGAGMIAIVGWIGEVMTKREAMGLGDVTLMAFVGAALGPSRALITVFVGATLGANGRRFFREHYEWPVIERKYLDLLERLVREPVRSTMEPLPPWIERRRRNLPPARDVVARLPRGASLEPAVAGLRS